MLRQQAQEEVEFVMSERELRALLFTAAVDGRSGFATAGRTVGEYVERRMRALEEDDQRGSA